MKLKNNRKNNLKKSELTSLEDLQQREDVVITIRQTREEQ